MLPTAVIQTFTFLNSKQVIAEFLKERSIGEVYLVDDQPRIVSLSQVNHVNDVVLHSTTHLYRVQLDAFILFISHSVIIM